MKASKMTNEQLAGELDNVLVNDELQSLADIERQQEAVREAAARLRRPTPVDDDLLKMANDIDKKNRKIAILEERVKIAIRAFEKIDAITKEEE